MTLDELQSEIDTLVQEPVTFKRVAANSIVIYFHGEPGDDTVRSFFISPTWRYQVNDRIIIGSYDLQLEEKDFQSKTEYLERFDYLCSLTDRVMGSTLEKCDIDLESSDITLWFSGGQVLRNFSNSAFDRDAWTYRGLPEQTRACVSPFGVTLGGDKE